MTTTKRTKREAKQLFRLCLVNGSLDEGRARQVALRVVAAGRRNGLPILSQFSRLVKLDRAQHTADIESATPLPVDLQGVIRSGLERRFGAGLTTTFTVRPALIGGIRIQVGSNVYDGSVLAGLAALEKKL